MTSIYIIFALGLDEVLGLPLALLVVVVLVGSDEEADVKAPPVPDIKDKVVVAVTAICAAKALTTGGVVTSGAATPAGLRVCVCSTLKTSNTAYSQARFSTPL
jgi:hypothetical protein